MNTGCLVSVRLVVFSRQLGFSRLHSPSVCRVASEVGRQYHIHFRGHHLHESGLGHARAPRTGLINRGKECSSKTTSVPRVEQKEKNENMKRVACRRNGALGHL